MGELLDATKQAHYMVDAEVARRIQIAKQVLRRLMLHHLSLAWAHFTQQVCEGKKMPPKHKNGGHFVQTHVRLCVCSLALTYMRYT